MEFDDFQSWFRRPRDRSGARNVTKTCSKKRLPEERKLICFLVVFMFFGSPRLGSQKCCQNGLRSPPGEPPGQSWGPPGSPKSINFSPPAGPGAAPSHFWDLGGGPPRAPRGGPRRAKEPEGPPREAPGRLLRPFWINFGPPEGHFG